MKVSKIALVLLVLLSVGVVYKGRHRIINYARENHWVYYQFPESKLAHEMLDHLQGVEIGASAHNPFNLNTRNIDYTDDYSTSFKEAEKLCTGRCAKVDIVASGDNLLLANGSVDFVISSHVIEHFYDPIKTVQEWLRVVKPGGYVYMIVPHKERTFDRDKARTTLAELIRRHEFPDDPIPPHHDHHSFWITADFIDLCDYMGWKIAAVQDVDDKVGNGFTVVIQKI